MPDATPTEATASPSDVALPEIAPKAAKPRAARKPRTPKTATAEDQAPVEEVIEAEDQAAVDEILNETEPSDELPETGAELLLFLRHECGPGAISRPEVAAIIEELPDEMLPLLHSVTDGWPVPQGASRGAVIKRIVASGATV